MEATDRMCRAEEAMRLFERATDEGWPAVWAALKMVWIGLRASPIARGWGFGTEVGGAPRWRMGFHRESRLLTGWT